MLGNPTTQILVHVTQHILRQTPHSLESFAKLGPARRDGPRQRRLLSGCCPEIASEIRGCPPREGSIFPPDPPELARFAGSNSGVPAANAAKSNRSQGYRDPL